MSLNLELSVSELRALQNMGKFRGAEGLQAIIGKSLPMCYAILRSLKKKGIMEGNNIAPSPYLKKLVLLLKKYPRLVALFRRKGLPILSKMLSEKSVKEISEEAMADEQTVYKVLQKAMAVSLVAKKGKKYAINAKAWPEAKDFFEELLRQKMSFDERIPPDSVIYYNSPNEIVFSNDRKLDFTTTAFSAFSRFGVPLFLHTNYYYASEKPKKRLSKKRIFKHALLVLKEEGKAKGELDMRNLTSTAIFKIKNKIKSNDKIAKKIDEVIAGKKIDGYPPKSELKEKALQYGVTLA